MGSTPTQQTSTSTSQPWEAQQPYLKEGFGQAQKIYQGSGPAYYPKSTAAPFSPNQNSAFGMGQNLATHGDPNMNAASMQNQKIMAGNYGDDVFKNVQSHVMPAVSSQFEGSGRYGQNASFGNAVSTGLTNAYAPYASSMMNQAIDRSPNFQASQWNNIQGLGDIGKQQQGQAQLETNDAINRYNYNTQLPQLKLNQYMQNVGGNWGNTTTTSQPVYNPSMFSQIAGGGLGLLGLLG